MPLAKERCLHLFCLTSSIFYRFLKLNQKCAFYLDAMLSKLFLLFMWSCGHSCVEVCEVSVKHSYVLRSLETRAAATSPAPGTLTPPFPPFALLSRKPKEPLKGSTLTAASPFLLRAARGVFLRNSVHPSSLKR